MQEPERQRPEGQLRPAWKQDGAGRWEPPEREAAASALTAWAIALAVIIGLAMFVLGTEHLPPDVFAALFLLALVALVPACIAYSKGHGFWGFYVFGLLFWPAALIVALTLGRLPKSTEQRCPACTAIIPRVARVCRYCGRDVA